MLPLVEVIVRDIVENFIGLNKKTEEFLIYRDVVGARPNRDQQIELEEIDSDIELHRKAVDSAVFELFTLGVEMKDYELGIVDFPASLGSEPVYLTWQLGELSIRHWHALDASYMDRHQIVTDDTRV